MTDRKPNPFLASERGSIAVLAGMLVMILTVVTGGAIEFQAAQSARRSMQSATDAATLSAARSYMKEGNAVAARKLANEIFESNLAGLDVIDARLELTFEPGGSTTARATGRIPSFITSAVYPDGIPFDATAGIGLQQRPIDIALVLDISSSMAKSHGGGTVLSRMQAAAKAFIDTMVASDADMRVALVPFSMTVNIGTDMGAYVTGRDHPFFAADPWAGCVFERPGNHRASDAYNGSDSADSGKWHAYIWPPEPDAHRADPADYCMNPGDGTGAAHGDPGGLDDRFDGWYPNWRDALSPLTFGPNFNCSRHPIVPLTDEHERMKSAIDGLTAHVNFGTIVGPGVAWGRRVLSAHAPFTQGGGDRRNARKVMIVLTDGEENTDGGGWNPLSKCHDHRHSNGSNFRFDPADFKLDGRALDGAGPESFMTPYGYILDSNPLGTGNGSFAGESADLGRISAEACAAAKEGGDLEIYTIGITANSAPGSRIYTLLENCATVPENFVYVSNVGSLTERFEEIADSFRTLSLAY